MTGGGAHERPPGTWSRFNRYMRSALSLREAMRRNRLDAEFADNDENEIVYLFDTNVFVFHADLADDQPLTRDFQELMGQEGEAALGKAVERVTAGYLFSGRLPGQRQSGFVTLPHFSEILVSLDAVARRLANEGKAARGVDDKLRLRVDSILANPALEPVEKLEQLGTVVPEAVLSTLDASAHFARTVRRAFLGAEGSLVPLDRRDWGQEAAAVTDGEVEAWLKVLPDPSRSRTEENLRDDAKSLQTVVNLYRGNTSSERAGRVKFLIVTVDESLADAVSQRAIELASEGIPEFVRPARDFTPLLNLNAMAEASGAVADGDGMRGAFGRVFETLGSALDWATVPSPREGRAVPEQPLKDLESAWILASRYATVLNASRIAEGADEVFARLRDFVYKEGRTAAELVEGSLVELRDRHVELLVDGALADLVASRRRSNGRRHRRVVLQLVGDVFGDLVRREMSISDFLDAAVKDGRLPEETTAALARTPERFEAQMLACAILVAAERWGPAAQFGARAVELANLTSGGRSMAASEAAYLLALCLRYSMRNVVQFKRAHGLLSDNLKRYSVRFDGPSTLPKQLRDQMELGTLEMQAAVSQELSRLPSAQALAQGVGRLVLLQDRLSDYWFRHGAERLLEARIMLQESASLESYAEGANRSQSGQLLAWLRSFSATNLLGAYVYERLVPGLQAEKPAIEDPADLLSEVEGELAIAQRGGKTPRPIMASYYWAARALRAQTPESRASALVKLLPHLDEPGPSEPRATGDRLETAFLRSWAQGPAWPDKG